MLKQPLLDLNILDDRYANFGIFTRLTLFTVRSHCNLQAYFANTTCCHQLEWNGMNLCVSSSIIGSTTSYD